MSTAIPSVDFDQDVETRRDDGGSGYGEGWFCVRTDPWPCPADACRFVAHFMTAAHLVLVWPSIDDRSLLAQARNAREADRNPRIVEYEGSFGKCISFDEWNRIGCPVHGFAAKPSGWSDRTGRRL